MMFKNQSILAVNAATTNLLLVFLLIQDTGRGIGIAHAWIHVSYHPPMMKVFLQGLILGANCAFDTSSRIYILIRFGI